MYVHKLYQDLQFKCYANMIQILPNLEQKFQDTELGNFTAFKNWGKILLLEQVTYMYQVNVGKKVKVAYFHSLFLFHH